MPLVIRFGAHRTYAGHLSQAVGFCLNRVEHLVAERPDQLLGVDRANSTDHAGAEIFLDPVD
jgi:hypothetical protein